jgi:hypothetical protein
MKPQLKDVISGFSHLETIEETKSNVKTYAHLEDPKINEEYQNKVSKHRVLYNEFIPNEKPCIEIVEENETFSFARFGNITTITGQSGAKKSFFVSAIAGAWINPEKLVLNRIKVTAPEDKRRVLYFDTEQSRGDVKEVLNRIIEIATFENLNEKDLELILCFSIKAMSPKERHEFISSTIHKEENIGLVIIDGIKDLMTSVNNEEQTSVIITDLLKWSEEQNIHICSILHENPLSEKMRGHIGTELINKCESVVSIQKNTENATRSEVLARKTRKKQFSNFAFRISEDGIPIFDENYEPEKIGRKPKIKIDKLDAYDTDSILNICFENEKELSYSELLEKIKSAFLTHKETSIGVNIQKDFLRRLKGENKITKVDPDNHKSKFIKT